MTLITKSDQLENLCRRWRRAPYLTVDTEFVRTSTFFSNLCLIQVADREGAVAVDPLAKGMNLAPFYAMLADKGVLKVLHAARQDVEIFYQQGETIPSPIFDTQIAAMVCGFGENAGYERLVKDITGKSLDKTQRFTDWARRPLSQRQIQYALDDVIYLRAVYETLKKRIDKAGRHKWVEEEVAILTDPETYITRPGEAWQRIRARSTNRRFLARVKELARLREEEAVKRNVPRNRVLSDKDITGLAALNPQTPKDIFKPGNFSRAVRDERTAQAVVRALARANALPDEQLPRPAARKNGKAPAGMLELLKVLLRQRCQEAGVAPKLVATSDELERFAASGGREGRFLKGWRRELFGADALKLLQGKIALSASSGGLKVLPASEA